MTWCPCAVPLNATLVLGFLSRMSPVCGRAWTQKAPRVSGGDDGISIVCSSDCLHR